MRSDIEKWVRALARATTELKGNLETTDHVAVDEAAWALLARNARHMGLHPWQVDSIAFQRWQQGLMGQEYQAHVATVAVTGSGGSGPSAPPKSEGETKVIQYTTKQEVGMLRPEDEARNRPTSFLEDQAKDLMKQVRSLEATLAPVLLPDDTNPDSPVMSCVDNTTVAQALQDVHLVLGRLVERVRV